MGRVAVAVCCEFGATDALTTFEDDVRADAADLAAAASSLAAVRIKEKPKFFLSTPWNGSRVRTQSAGRAVEGEKSATEWPSQRPLATASMTNSALRT